ncbi:hypothetical protein LTSEUGA_0811 [Salmonella enterica subsp. enterica serovar Uganda str. R8-3404]|uniref:Uncharacterized protein n=3 Tax=Salmonella enterica I TaxID=59201 RepID=G5QW01_SALSE|nr:hypothetical protein SCA50_0594 [Salmonella enterica subsp. enterica serovar Choleraesuis str. SCSA50]EHC93377.1 hypothetical protein LTSESEN_0845 [Salmonella enterica subsp. enterica serovar Senftenberg str. A4-543]EHC95481.1 hypothetical protein LTSEUGA_0811 [Salmonella enterica subsp. enterica serovar Uganda str. R8-3404]
MQYRYAPLQRLSAFLRSRLCLSWPAASSYFRHIYVNSGPKYEHKQ